MEISLSNTFYVKPPPFFFRSSTRSLLNHHPPLYLSVSNQTQIQKSIICAANKKRRSGSGRSIKFMLQSVYFIASKLNILPEPLDLLIREFSGGNGGRGLGFRKEFDWGGFDGRRRKQTKLWFWVFLIVCGMWFWFILGKEFDFDVFWGGLGLSLLGISVNWLKVEVKDWILGFCSCAFLVGLGMRREKLQSWAKGFRAIEIVRRRKRRGVWRL